ncbi:MAG: hypothetical protein HYX32_14620 [Actinobacteria bacterium]|nr:hypothetical protein [Actinomycetota bacterium]
MIDVDGVAGLVDAVEEGVGLDVCVVDGDSVVGVVDWPAAMPTLAAALVITTVRAASERVPRPVFGIAAPP